MSCFNLYKWIRILYSLWIGSLFITKISTEYFLYEITVGINQMKYSGHENLVWGYIWYKPCRFLLHLSQRLMNTIVIMSSLWSIGLHPSIINFSDFTSQNYTLILTKLPSLCFLGRYVNTDGCPDLWLAKIFSTSHLQAQGWQIDFQMTCPTLLLATPQLHKMHKLKTTRLSPTLENTCLKRRAMGFVSP